MEWVLLEAFFEAHTVTIVWFVLSFELKNLTTCKVHDSDSNEKHDDYFKDARLLVECYAVSQEVAKVADASDEVDRIWYETVLLNLFDSLEIEVVN